MVDARLPDGSRVNAIIPPLALDGSKLTIRKFSEDPYTVEDLITFGTLTRPSADLLEACVRGRLNILVSGGTGAGKTTTLNVLSSFIPDDERIVTIEDAAELRLGQDHVLRLESRPANIEGKGAVTIRDLVKNSLRMRPDRVVVGEIRDAAALDMLQAMNTGHDGSISTLHANTPRDALSRLETMVLMAGMDLPVRAIREQVASAVDLIIQQTPSQGRHPPHHRHHRDRRHGGRHHHDPGRLPLRLRRRGRTSTASSRADLKSTGPATALPRAPARPRCAHRPRRVRDRRRAMTPRRWLVRAAVAVAGLIAALSPADPQLTPRTRSPSTTSRRPTARSDVVLSVDGFPRSHRSTRPPSRSRSTAAPSTRRPRPSPPATSSAPRCSCSTRATACSRAASSRPPRPPSTRSSPLPRATSRIGLVTFAGEVVDRSSSRPPTTQSVAARWTSITLQPRHQRLRRHRRGRRRARARMARDRSWCSPTAPTPAATPPSRSCARDAADAGVVVDVVSLAAAARADELAGLADATNGQVIPADPARSGERLRRSRQTPWHSSCSSPSTRRRRHRRRVDRRNASTPADRPYATRPSSRLRYAAHPSSTSSQSGKSLVSRPVMLLGAAGACTRAGRSPRVRSLSAPQTPRSATERRLDAYFDAGRRQGEAPARPQRTSPTSRGAPSR